MQMALKLLELQYEKIGESDPFKKDVHNAISEFKKSESSYIAFSIDNIESD